MKQELEQKAKAYDEALKVIKGNLDALNEITETGTESVNIQAIKNCFYRAFPELKESEDEKMLRTIIRGFENWKSNGMETFNNTKVDDILDYLEKQKINTEGDFGRGYDCGYKACLNSHGAEFFEKQKEQKPAEWSEEDEKDMAHIIRILDDCYAYGKHDLSKTDHENLVNKLKSLRPQPKQEWSEEDEAIKQKTFKAGAEWQKKQVSEYLDKWMEHATRGSEKGNHIYHLGKIDLILAIQEWLKEEEMR